MNTGQTSKGFYTPLKTSVEQWQSSTKAEMEGLQEKVEVKKKTSHKNIENTELCGQNMLPIQK